MSNSNEHSQNWECCQGGELRQVVRKSRIGKRNRELTRFGASVAMVLALVAVVAVVARRNRGLDDHRYGGISCAQTKLHLAGYIAGELDSNLTGQIEKHLADCPSCARVHERMQVNADPTASAPPGAIVTATVLPAFAQP